MKTDNLTRYTCDCCGKCEYATKSETSPMQQYRLPMKYYDETGRNHGLTNSAVDLCKDCSRDLESILSAYYEMYSQAYVGVQMKKREPKESEDTE
jgi:hypothetical protein